MLLCSDSAHFDVANAYKSGFATGRGPYFITLQEMVCCLLAGCHSTSRTASRALQPMSLGSAMIGLVQMQGPDIECREC